MGSYQWYRFVGLVAVGVAVLSTLMLTAIGARSLPGTTRSLALSWTIDALQLLKVAAGLAIVAGILWLMIGRTRRTSRVRGKEPTRKRGTFALLVVIGVLALLIWLIPERSPSEEEETPPEVGFAEEVEFLPTENIGQVWPLLALVAGVAIAATAVKLIGREPERAPDEAAPGAILADTFADAIEELSWSDDPKAAIIKAYHDIERSLGENGLSRLASEAPREYLHRVLAGAEVDRMSITRLTDLFERARFSDHELTEADRAEAIDAMEAVRAELVVPAS